MAGEGETDLEATVRRWFALANAEPRPIGAQNAIVARLAKFSRSEIRKIRRRIVTEPGPAGERQAIVAYLSLAHGTEKPVILAPDETLAFPAVLALAGFAALICQAMRGTLEASRRAVT